MKGTTRKTVRKGVILGLFFGGGFIFQTWGLAFTSVSRSAFITGIAILLVPFVYKIVEKKKIRKWPKVGIVIALIGLWLFTNPEADKLNLGDFLTLISTVFWAFYITYMDVFTRGEDSFSITVQLVIFQFVGAAGISLISFFITDLRDFHLTFNTDLLISLAYNGIMASFLLTFLHTAFQKFTTPVKAALIFSLEPVLASFFAIMFFGESLTVRAFVGAAILLSGVLVSEIGDHMEESRRQKLSA